MVKFMILFVVVIVSLWGNRKVTSPELERECFQCHEVQKIPSEAIYRRYLLKYSSKKTIAEKMLIYLKTPSVEGSIMPPQFFRKYPIKEMLHLKEEILRKRIDEYIRYFDIDKKLFVPNESN
jgi:hypothetical protein